ncbi:hypothetical protein A0257_13855 [Hymenobacter psoromatis]|nr:hypothetical protein A0257_13855 [Hymenobacter psoromatis]
MAKTAKLDAPTARPYLKQVRIRNHAPLRDAQVSFEPGLNIIIGPNGSGKTRFLELTSQLMNLYITQKAGVECELILNYGQDIKISFQKELWAEDEEPNFQLADVDAIKVFVAWGGEISNGTTLLDALLRFEDETSFSQYDVVLAQHGTPLQRCPVVDVPATLIFGELLGMRVEPELVAHPAVVPPLLPNALFNAFIQAFFWLQRHQRANRLAENLLDSVCEEIKRITTAYLDFLNSTLAICSPIKQVRLGEAFQLYDNQTQKELIVKGLVLEYYIAENWLPFEALSDGTKRILYLISQLIMPFAKFYNQSEYPTPFSLRTLPRIILLEEPELGIHPDQLQMLLSLIREVSKEHQVIITTHSPQVLNMLTKQELDRITICELDPKKGTQFRKLSRAKQAKARAYMRDDSYLSDFWLYSNLEAK